MRVLHINNTDLPGARFNGYSMLLKQEQLGIKVSQLVLDKYSHSPYVKSVKLAPSFHTAISTLEHKNSVRCLNFPYVDRILQTQEYKVADVVHFHLLHNEMVSLFELPKLFSNKVSLWTIHDPWILTGHCVYPMDCKAYLTGCGNCPDLERPFHINEDTTALMWKIKQNTFKQLSIPLVVASDWMKNLIQTHPFGVYFPHITKIPFGIDLSMFSPVDTNKKIELRNKEGIPNNFTIFFREDPSIYKGMKFIIEALKLLRPELNISIITVGAKNILGEEIYERFFVKEYGWVNSEEEIANLYQMADVFIMPSSAESFGVMAIESLACGIPLLIRKGTAVSELAKGGEVGVVFSDSEDLKSKIEILYFSPDLRVTLSSKSRELALSEYSEEMYHDRLLELYDSLLRSKEYSS